jgi:hypothetical protein
MKPCRRPWGAHVRSERLAWSREQGIDYRLGRTPAPRLAALGLGQVAGTAETAVYSGRLDDQLIDRFLAQSPDPRWSTQTIAVIAVHARAPGG